MVDFFFWNYNVKGFGYRESLWNNKFYNFVFLCSDILYCNIVLYWFLINIFLRFCYLFMIFDELYLMN